MKVYRFSATVKPTERFNRFDCDYCTSVAIITEDDATPEYLNKKYNGKDGIVSLDYTYAMNACWFNSILTDCKHIILDDKCDTVVNWIR